MTKVYRALRESGIDYEFVGYQNITNDQLNRTFQNEGVVLLTNPLDEPPHVKGHDTPFDTYDGSEYPTNNSISAMSDAFLRFLREQEMGG